MTADRRDSRRETSGVGARRLGAYSLECGRCYLPWPFYKSSCFNNRATEAGAHEPPRGVKIKS